MRRREVITAAAAVAAAGAAFASIKVASRGAPTAELRPVGDRDRARVPEGYPQSYAGLISRAEAEGRLNIYSATDLREMAPVLNEFNRLYPNIRIDYSDLGTNELYSRFIAESASGGRSADILFSSAMDLQIKLVNDGYAQPYSSPEKPHLSNDSVWKDEAYAITSEPVVFVYNKRAMEGREIPQSHRDLRSAISANPEAWKGRITSYDPVKSGLGFLYMTQDIRFDRNTWSFIEALGKTSPKFYTSTGTMLERIISGEHHFGFNIIGSYALEKASKDPSIGVIFPSDYTLTMSRIALISRQARNVSAARLFLDHMLSKNAQKLLEARHMTSIRSESSPVLRMESDSSRIIPIKVGPGLLVNLDQEERLKFIRRWNELIGL
jgi:iron(III) transport system substrate-binding protein